MTKILVMLIFLSLISLHINDVKAEQLIEAGTPQGSILLFPEPITGPQINTQIVKFVVFDVSNIPEVDLDIGMSILENVEVVTINFEEEKKFLGFFYLPDTDLYIVWINENPIVWEVE